MFEKYIEMKEQNLAEQVNLTAEYINLFEIIFNPKIEQAYKTFFSAEVDWWLYEEQVAREANCRFNFENPKLNAFLKQLDELSKKNARFSTISLPMIISTAVKTRLNYLCRPRTALKWFVYRWDQIKTYHEIIKRINYLDDYKYLKEGFIEYVRCHQLIKSSDDTISIAVFDRIINEIDSKYIEKLSPEEFIQMMSPLFAFFNQDTEHKDTAKIPVEAVIVYFDDKNMMTMASRLETMFRSGELHLISKKYLLGLIYKSLYDADLLYGGGEDTVTKVTNEIINSNINYSGIDVAASASNAQEKQTKVVSIDTMPEQFDSVESEHELQTQFVSNELNDDVSIINEMPKSEEIDNSEIISDINHSDVQVSEDNFEESAQNVPESSIINTSSEYELDLESTNFSAFGNQFDQIADNSSQEESPESIIAGFDIEQIQKNFAKRNSELYAEEPELLPGEEEIDDAMPDLSDFLNNIPNLDNQ